MHETSARGWCTGMAQRDEVGREAEGGSGWGTHVNPCFLRYDTKSTNIKGKKAWSNLHNKDLLT